MPNFFMARAVTQQWQIVVAIAKVFDALTKSHHLHRPEPIGMFAGSLLHRSDWDH